MEHIIRKSIYPQAAHPIPKLRPSPLVLIVFGMVIGFTVVIVSARMAAQYKPPLADPFPAYADILPGQPASAVKTRPFSCKKYDNDYPYAETDCALSPPEGIFSRIDVVIAGGTILQITFIMRDNTLTMGDLARLLAIPAIHRSNRLVYFPLPTSRARVVTKSQGEPFSWFSPVWGITFMPLS